MSTRELNEDLPLRRGAVGVIVRDERLLVIRRSQHVRAPGMFCFPGGGIEEGESEEAALVREFQEELGVNVCPLARLWESTTPWRVHLAWWSVALDDARLIVPNAAEVAEVHWLTTHELRALPDLLASNHAFLDALDAGAFALV